MFNKILQFISLILLFTALPAQAETTISLRVAGKILLQVESPGEAWYVNPKDQKKYFLGKPKDAFALMKTFGIGITDKDLNKIPVGLTGYLGTDDDADGLANSLELALGTDSQKKDSDDDGFADLTEITNNFNPTRPGKILIVNEFAKKNSGKVFLQVENRGQGWYINPSDNKRYYLGSPDEAFLIMKKLGLGISNDDLGKIATGYFYNQPATPAYPGPATNQNTSQTIYQAGEAIRKNETEKVVAYFSANMAPVISYTMNFLTADGRFIWSEMLTGSSLLTTTETEKIYHNYVYFQGEKIEIKYHVKKQLDGNWLIANL